MINEYRATVQTLRNDLATDDSMISKVVLGALNYIAHETNDFISNCYDACETLQDRRDALENLSELIERATFDVELLHGIFCDYAALDDDVTMRLVAELTTAFESFVNPDD
jgi:hypothetical protein